MDYMYNACSTTARRGALDWAKVFEETNLPVFERLYESVKNGSETRRSLEFNGRSTYREDLAKELKEIDEQEIWRAGTSTFHYRLNTRVLIVFCRQGCPFAAPRQLVVSARTCVIRCRAYTKALAWCTLDLWCSIVNDDLMWWNLPFFSCDDHLRRVRRFLE